MKTSRRILCIGLAILLLVSLAGISLAGPNQDNKSDEDRERMTPGHADGMMLQQQNDGFPMGVPVEVFHSGHGFALRGNESNIIRLKIEVLMPLESGQIRGMLASNKSLEEIRDDIRAREGNETYRGSVILSHTIYPLINIIAVPADDNSTALRADLADLDLLNEENDTAILGRISVIVSPSDGGMIGKGELDLFRGVQAGRYSILLEMESPWHGPRMMQRMSK